MPRGVERVAYNTNAATPRKLACGAGRSLCRSLRTRHKGNGCQTAAAAKLSAVWTRRHPSPPSGTATRAMLQRSTTRCRISQDSRRRLRSRRRATHSEQPCSAAHTVCAARPPRRSPRWTRTWQLADKTKGFRLFGCFRDRRTSSRGGLVQPAGHGRGAGHEQARSRAAAACAGRIRL